MQKTEQALLDAMSELIGEKPIEKITVSDLCSAATIRRATFYAHFRDKGDFLDFCIQRRQEDFDARHDISCGTDALDYYIDTLRDMLRFLRENQSLVECTIKRADSPAMPSLFARQLTQSILDNARRLDEHNVTLVAPPEVLASFLASALLGVARWWFMEKPDMTESELITHIRTLLAACAPHLIAPSNEKGTHTKEGHHER